MLRALSREGEAASQVLQGLVQETMGLSGAAETASFVIKTLLRADNENVARAAVEALAMLAATAALAAVHPGHAELFAQNRLSPSRGRMYGAADLAPEHCRSLLERALP